MPPVATLREVDQLRNVERGLTGWVDAVLATEGRFYERIEYLGQCADRTVHDPAARLETRAETANRWASIPANLSVLRADHISSESALPGVWRGQYP